VIHLSQRLPREPAASTWRTRLDLPTPGAREALNLGEVVSTNDGRCRGADSHCLPPWEGGKRGRSKRCRWGLGVSEAPEPAGLLPPRTILQVVPQTPQDKPKVYAPVCLSSGILIGIWRTKAPGTRRRQAPCAPAEGGRASGRDARRPADRQALTTRTRPVQNQRVGPSRDSRDYGVADG
jgi:hypothetical protein